MGLHVRVDGGTGAGSKRPLREKPAEWECGCPSGRALDTPAQAREAADPGSVRKRNPGFLVRCVTCGMSRPSA